MNPQNYFVTHPSVSLPVTTTDTFADDIELLDEKHNILSVSKSRSSKLRNQCFITFKSSDDASEFVNQFRSNLKVRGRDVKIGYASKDSLLAVSLSEEHPTLFAKILGTRHKKSLLRLDEHSRLQHILHRRSRRLRGKLRKHGVDSAEIEKRVAKLQKELLDTHANDGKADTAASEIHPAPTHTEEEPPVKKRKISNPPSNRLLVQDVPPQVSQQDLESLFDGDGLKSVRLLAVRNVAFIEYDNTEHAASVLEKLGDEYSLDGTIITITFAK